MRLLKDVVWWVWITSPVAVVAILCAVGASWSATKFQYAEVQEPSQVVNAESVPAVTPEDAGTLPERLYCPRCKTLVWPCEELSYHGLADILLNRLHGKIGGTGSGGESGIVVHLSSTPRDEVVKEVNAILAELGDRVRIPVTVQTVDEAIERRRGLAQEWLDEIEAIKRANSKEEKP